MPEESGKSVITIEDSPPTNCVLSGLLPSEEVHINLVLGFNRDCTIEVCMSLKWSLRDVAQPRPDLILVVYAKYIHTVREWHNYILRYPSAKLLLCTLNRCVLRQEYAPCFFFSRKGMMISV